MTVHSTRTEPPLRIEVERELLRVGDDAVRFHAAHMGERVFCRLFAVWYERLREGGAGVLLPYNVREEFVDAFEVRGDRSLTLHVVVLDSPIFFLGEDSLMAHALSAHRIIQRHPVPFLRCERDAFVQALLEALDCSS